MAAWASLEFGSHGWHLSSSFLFSNFKESRHPSLDTTSLGQGKQKYKEILGKKQGRRIRIFFKIYTTVINDLNCYIPSDSTPRRTRRPHHPNPRYVHLEG
jgi:hypothetical protein